MPDTQNEFRPEFTDLVQLLEGAVARFSDRPLFGALLNDNDTIQWITYREFETLVDKFRAGLHAIGVRAGDAVAVISNNRLEWAVGMHAVAGLGGRYVPMYESQNSEDWRYMLDDSDASVCLVASDAVAARLARVRGALPKLREVVNFEGPSSDAKSYSALLAAGASLPVEKRRPEPDDVAILIYTSGTTGKAKGVMLTHNNLAANVAALLSAIVVQDDDRALAFLPWAHIFGGCIELNLTVLAGASTVICPDPMRLPIYLPKVQPTVLFAVPRVWNKIYDGVQKLMAGQEQFQGALRARAKQRRDQTPTTEELEALAWAQANVFPMIRTAFGGKLKYAGSGAAGLSPEVAEFMDTLGIDVYEGYGMTETGGVMTLPLWKKLRLGSVGACLPGVRITLDNNVPAAGPDEGEIIVYGSGVMAGYYKQPEATQASMTADGGFRTGDIGRMDPDGYLYITGRAKELYKLENGKYVAPIPLEEALSLSPHIVQAVVYGSERKYNVALIVPDVPSLTQWATQNGADASPEGLLSDPKVVRLLETEVDKANSTFKGHERIQNFVIEPEELTHSNGMLTQTFKLKRRAFTDKYGAALDALYPRASEPAKPRALIVSDLQASVQT
ncbi:MAG: hypothetical protein RL701_2885 [Pseudomonadota bacterium]|jgi:long-chain acyl-CoA synthetase